MNNILFQLLSPFPLQDYKAFGKFPHGVSKDSEEALMDPLSRLLPTHSYLPLVC